MLQFTLDGSVDEIRVAEQVLDRVDSGEIVVIPTETQYGLCCDSRNIDAMKKLNRIKKRDASIPSAVFVNDWERASRLVVNTPPGTRAFVQHFWPGPLTIVAQSREKEWYGIVSATGNIGFRCSSHRFVSALSEGARYLCATSANVHGEEPPTGPDAIIKWLKADIELFIFDSTVRANAVPSTVISIAEGKLEILREGAIDPSEIERVWRETTAGSVK